MKLILRLSPVQTVCQYLLDLLFGKLQFVLAVIIYTIAYVYRSQDVKGIFYFLRQTSTLQIKPATDC